MSQQDTEDFHYSRECGPLSRELETAVFKSYQYTEWRASLKV